MQGQSLTGLVEALIFAAGRPISIEEIIKITKTSFSDTQLAVDKLKHQYSGKDHGIELRQVAGGMQFFVRTQYAQHINQMLQPQVRPKLSQAALETLAIIAYRQPITRAEIELIRGVRIDAVLVTLQDRNLVEEVGRLEGPGRPMLYGTTKHFLQCVGLENIKHLPKPK